jgi:hypothetical protein
MHDLAKSDRSVAATSGRPGVAALSAHRHSKREIAAAGRRFGQRHYVQSFILPGLLISHRSKTKSPNWLDLYLKYQRPIAMTAVLCEAWFH